MRKFLLLFLLGISINTGWAKDYLITSYGVVADSTKLNTAAIQKVIDLAASKGGGTILIPKGTFLSGALFFKPNTRLTLRKGAVLKGSDNIEHYPLIPSRMEGKSLKYYAALINAYQVNNFSISGPGTINGNGLRFWKQFWAYRDSLKQLNQVATNLDVHRPRLLFIWGCDNVNIKNVNLKNSGFWTTHLYQSNNVLIEGCNIRSPYEPIPAPSTDGIDIDFCKNVTVRNCYIAVNDDAVCIKGGKGVDARNLPENGPTENVLIENCTFGPSHATLTIGSESIFARNITMRNCKVNNNCPLIRFKMRPDTFQTFENIKVENITGVCGTIINLNSWKQFFTLDGSSEKPFGIVKNITLSNINVKCDKLGEIEGNGGDKISDIVLRNITAEAKSPNLKTKYPGVSLENVVVNGKGFELAAK